MAITKLPRNGIADDAVNDSKIEDGTVAITEVSGTITNAKLKDGDIANAKLSNSSVTIRGSSRALGDSFTLGVDFDWQSVKTGDTTMVAGQGYFVDTSSSTISMTLPSSASAGDSIAIKDYAGTFGSNKCTILRNSHNIQGIANNSDLSTNRASVVLVYVDSTKGWLFINEHNVGDLEGPTFISATGGTITTSGNFKIHTFTGDGNFVVASVGNCKTPAPERDKINTLVIAGGGGSGYAADGCSPAGAGGAGGYRFNSAIPVSASPGTYPVTVGGGGSGGTPGDPALGSSGSNSVFGTITSAGGGGGGGVHTNPGSPRQAGANGGSGGGGSEGNPDVPSFATMPGGSGNTPPVSPPQGNNGGNGVINASGAGGGAGGAGANASPCGPGGNAGTGSSGWPGDCTVRASGGAGSSYTRPLDGTKAPAGGGGGALENGTANTGGGAGGASGGNSYAGGKGVVIIRYKFQ